MRHVERVDQTSMARVGAACETYQASMAHKRGMRRRRLHGRQGCEHSCMEGGAPALLASLHNLSVGAR